MTQKALAEYKREILWLESHVAWLYRQIEVAQKNTSLALKIISKKRGGSRSSSGIVLRRVTVEQWSGVKEASKVLGVTPQQVSRHINASGPADAQYSKALAARMIERGVEVAR